MGVRGQGATIGDLDTIRPALRRPRDTEMWRGMGQAWDTLSTLVAGIAVWGGIGWGVDRLAGTRPIFFVVGVLIGNFGGIYLAYVKSSREEGKGGAGCAP